MTWIAAVISECLVASIFALALKWTRRHADMYCSYRTVRCDENLELGGEDCYTAYRFRGENKAPSMARRHILSVLRSARISVENWIVFYAG
jgi:hypothetical protein